MILVLRVGFLSYRLQKMAVRAWFLRRCQSHRSFLFIFTALCLTGLTLVALFGSILGRRKGSRLEYVVVVGTDSHPSVLRLNRSLISVRRIELRSPTCIDCESPPVGPSARPVIGVFLVQGEIHSDHVFNDTLELQRSRHVNNGEKSPLEFQVFNLGDNGVKGPPEVQGSIRKDDGVKVPLQIREPIRKEDSLRSSFNTADGPLTDEEKEREQEKDRTFINCLPSFDYSVYVVVRSDATDSNGARMPSEDGIIHAVNPWIDGLLRRTTEECRKQRVNVTVWLIAISPELNFVNALNDVLIEAYFDNVTWYDLLIWSDPAQRRGHAPLKWAEQPTELLARTKNVGVVTSGGSRLFFHRRHYEIFGNFFPLADWTLDTAVRYLLRLYSPLWLTNQPSPLADHTATEGRYNVTVGGGNRFDGISGGRIVIQDVTEIVAIDRHLLERYVKALDATDFDLRRGDNTRRSGRVISMSLYGDDPKYTLGAVRNAQLLPVIYPGWRLFIFCERRAPSETAEGGASCVSVPLQVTRKLEELGAELKLIAPGGLAPMMWRFLPVDDVTVDVFISRDSDSRLTERDAAVVSAWLDSDTLFHCIRDHPSHADFSVSGGLWGARTKWLRLVLGNRPITSLVQYSSSYLEDMRFLGSELWPLVQSLAYCHDSVSCDRWPNSHPFPVQRRRTEHVGQVYDAHSIPRQNDIDILTAAERNAKCEPDRFS